MSQSAPQTSQASRNRFIPGLLVGLLLGGGISGAVAIVLLHMQSLRHAEAMAALTASPVKAAMDLVTDKIRASPTAPTTVSHPQSDQAARDFLENIRGNRPDSAYKFTTPEFQQRLKLDDFKKMIDKYPLPQRDAAMAEKDYSAIAPIDSKTYVYQFRTATKDGKPITFRIVVVETSVPLSAGFSTVGWRVDDFTIHEDTKGGRLAGE